VVDVDNGVHARWQEGDCRMIYIAIQPLCLENGGKGSNKISKRGNCAKTRAAFSKRDAPFKPQMLITWHF